MGLFGLGRGEPVAFEFSLEVQSLSPWSSQRPVRRLALRWQRGSKVRFALAVGDVRCAAAASDMPPPVANTVQRSGVSRAVHPRSEANKLPGAPLTYDFNETLNVPATLYKARCLTLPDSALPTRLVALQTRPTLMHDSRVPLRAAPRHVLLS